jgi:bifunctional DNA-binding transcriptional regulator/antitoxin component of YhaV-PrlF toxin-antitoxin module
MSAVTIQINARGSLTLPKLLRRRLGLERGGVVLAEASEQGIVLKPSVTFPIEIYTDKRVAAFDAADAALDRRLKRKRT